MTRKCLSWHGKYQLLMKAYFMKFAFSSGYLQNDPLFYYFKFEEAGACAMSQLVEFEL